MKAWIELKEWRREEENPEFLLVVHSDDYADGFVYKEIEEFIRNDIAFNIVDKIEGIPYHSITVTTDDLVFRVYYDPVGGISSFVSGKKSEELNTRLHNLLIGILKELNKKFGEGE